MVTHFHQADETGKCHDPLSAGLAQELGQWWVAGSALVRCDQVGFVLEEIDPGHVRERDPRCLKIPGEPSSLPVATDADFGQVRADALADIALTHINEVGRSGLT